MSEFEYGDQSPRLIRYNTLYELGLLTKGEVHRLTEQPHKCQCLDFSVERLSKLLKLWNEAQK